MTTALMCLPFAGGGASLFRPWQSVSGRFTVVPIQLPGREELFIEDPHTRMADAAADCAQRIAERSADQPIAIFGHSFGALLAYETAVLLPADRVSHLIVSGAVAPWLDRPAVGAAEATDDELVAAVRDLVGYEHPSVRDPELRELIVPALRADMMIQDRYESTAVGGLQAPVTVLRGDRDELVSADGAAAWRQATTGAFRMIQVPGGHMYFSDDWPLLWTTIEAALS